MTEHYGWESCFYLVGSLTCIWFAFWICLVHNSPEEHPRISEEINYLGLMLRYSKVPLFQEEMAYMKANIPPRKSKLPRVPVLDIMKTRGFWGFLFAHLGSMWGNFTMWTSIPLYLNNIQHFSLKAVRKALDLLFHFTIKS